MAARIPPTSTRAAGDDDRNYNTLEWNLRQGGTWVAYRHEITYRRPAVYGDELEITTRVEAIRGARAVRRTTIVRVSDRARIADAVTEWIWIRLLDVRPARVPAELVAAFAGE